MKKYLLFVTVLLAAAIQAAQSAAPDNGSANGSLGKAKVAEYGDSTSSVMSHAGKQIELCMIGDSITWAGEGDYFRHYLLKHMPELAFVGTHTAKLGYSHAGEGGNNTVRVLARIDNPDSIPDARYYHVLIGVNDNAARSVKDAEGAQKRGEKTVENIVKIVHELEKRPTTEKVFLGTILPCSDGKMESNAMEFRDLAGQATNRELRARFEEFFPSGKVVLVEYENALRPLPNVRPLIRLHPTVEGYELVAKILADSLKAHTTAALPDPSVIQYGVEVRNLWDSGEQSTASLIPGWYMFSFEVEKVSGDKLEFTIESKSLPELKAKFGKDYSLPAKAGERISVEVFTGYQGYGYDQAPFEIKIKNGEISHVMVEKMRPSKSASIYGEGVFVDAVSPMALGEKLVALPF